MIKLYISIHNKLFILSMSNVEHCSCM